jgi:hypothetical protein
MPLTTVAAVKLLGGISAATHDGLLATLVSAAEAAARAHCERAFDVASYDEWRSGTGGAAMLLREWPVVSVSAVTVDEEPVPAADWRVRGRTLSLLNGRKFARGIDNVRIQYSAGHAVIPADVALAAAEIALLEFRRRDNSGHMSKSLAGETVTFEKLAIPASAAALLSAYRRVAPL